MVAGMCEEGSGGNGAEVGLGGGKSGVCIVVFPLVVVAGLRRRSMVSE